MRVDDVVIWVALAADGYLNIPFGMILTAGMWLGVVKGPFLETELVDDIGNVAPKATLAAGVWLGIAVERPVLAAEVWLGVVGEGPFLATELVDGAGNVAPKAALTAGVWLGMAVESHINREVSS